MGHSVLLCPCENSLVFYDLLYHRIEHEEFFWVSYPEEGHINWHHIAAWFPWIVFDLHLDLILLFSSFPNNRIGIVSDWRRRFVILPLVCQLDLHLTYHLMFLTCLVEYDHSAIITSKKLGISIRIYLSY